MQFILLKEDGTIINVGVGNIATGRECKSRNSEDGSSRGLKEWGGRKINTALPPISYF
jgi:hypothetical protein